MEHNAMSRNFCVVFTNGASIGMNMQATMSKNSSNNCFTWSSIKGSPMCTKHTFFAILHKGLKIERIVLFKEIALKKVICKRYDEKKPLMNPNKENQTKKQRYILQGWNNV